MQEILVQFLGQEDSPGEEIGYLLQYTWASLVAQMVKNLLAMWEIWIQSLGQEDALEKGAATHSSILAWGTPMNKGTQQYSVHGVAKNWTGLSDFHTYTHVTLCDSMDYSPLGSTVFGIRQTRILELFVMSSSRGSSQLRDQTQVFYFSCIGWQVLYQYYYLGSPYVHKDLVKSLNEIAV